MKRAAPFRPWLNLLAGLWLVGAGAGLRAAEAAAASDAVAPTVVLVTGAVGEADYATNFVRQTELWSRVATTAQARLWQIGTNNAAEPDDREALHALLGREATNGPTALWLVLIGHGTFDGAEARFNLRGPDVTAGELAEWLKPCARPLVLIDTTAASAPFLLKLAGTNRVVITATRSGNELSFARFGGFLAEALGRRESDLDQDGQVSLLEAFLSAAHSVAEWYQTAGRLATEHALVDDNGDGQGTPAEWFRGVRPVRQAQGGAPLDGARAHQVHLVMSPEERALTPAARARRDALELEVFRLRDTKSKLPEAEYYRKLEALLLELARVQGASAVSEAAR